MKTNEDNNDNKNNREMKTKVLFLALLAQMCCLTAMAKTTYIPTYKSYIHIVNGTDTVSVDGILPELEMAEANGLFTIRFEHEEVTKEKVKDIKRAKRAAGWAGFAAVMSGVSTAFSDNSLQYFIRSTNTRIATDLTTIYAANAENEQILTIELWIDNPTDSELMVNDMERGLTWFILPKQSMNLKVNNPEAARLRISDAHNGFVRYVTAAAGSSVKKWNIGWEDDECWVVEVYKDNSPHIPENQICYRRISKIDFSESDMSIPDFSVFKKEKKKEKAKK